MSDKIVLTHKGKPIEFDSWEDVIEFSDKLRDNAGVNYPIPPEKKDQK